MSGDLVYFQINVADGEKAKAFYAGLFGWEIGHGNVEEGFQFGGPTPHGGALGGGKTDPRPLVYFDVDELDDGIARVKELGGEAGEAKETGMGRYALCKDDQGVEFGIFEFAEE